MTRHATSRWVFALVLVSAGWWGGETARAYQRYTEGCQSCHGGFLTPTSAVPNNTWPASKHTRHQAMVSSCSACHVVAGDNPNLGVSAGTADLPAIGCLGCHGRNYGTVAQPVYTAAGLRAHHAGKGVAICATCHEGDPAPLPESVLPVYYGKTGVAITDSCNSNGSENWTSDGLGLDNDGDGLYDTNDPDCQGDPCVDQDGDGYVDTTAGCVIPPGKLPGDCDDTDAAIHPGATEVCDDGIDNDCDGFVDGDDPGCSGSQTLYVGSETCAACHNDYYQDFRVSGHPYKLAPRAEARNRPIPLPAGLNWDDISYVIGGFKWKARYLDNNGYIITRLPNGITGMNQYNQQTGRWVNYEAGKVKKYDCGPCHTTGYSKEGRQDGLPGIVGTWAAPGIQCEACHGPGKFHVEQGARMVVNRRASACGSCHARGNVNAVPASGGFVRHHEQYNELLASPHRFLECVDCHNPHKKAEWSIIKNCADCHADVAASYEDTLKHTLGISCADCHMPAAGVSAEPLGPHRGDVQTHLFRINTDPTAYLFENDRAKVKLDATGHAAVTLDFACLQCHQDVQRKPGVWSEGALKWAARYAAGFHQSKLGTKKIRRPAQ